MIETSTLELLLGAFLGLAAGIAIGTIFLLLLAVVVYVGMR